MKWLHADKKKQCFDTFSEETSPQLLLQSVKDAHEEILLLRGRLAEYKWLEEALRERTHELDERIKELECLYAVSSSLMNHHLSPEQILDAVIREIPHGWQYPHATSVRIIIHGREFASPNFRSAPCRQYATVQCDDTPIGLVEICLLPEFAQGQSLAFLKEEQALLNIIALWLGEMFRHRTEECW